ncbi:hypothetical protein [Methyloceanibacter methanicus]|uniref:hypothetical protein n=1 Tax=Methyloceanibacter methanicus TaxID=1774968 RepID=UPI001FCDEC26|nr:hypothetical protein [Methyloceanibacter methanicus]
MSVAAYFELNESEAKQIAAQVGAAVANWRARAAELGLSRTEINRMASAFEHDDLDEARALAAA